MKHWIALLLALWLSGCASRLPAAPPTALLHDALFAAPSVEVDPASVLALSDDMRQYAAEELKSVVNGRDPRRALLDALYTRGKLRLSYDAAVTRNAAESFQARAGNCLSLVIMTAAFAKHLGLPVSYRSVLVDDLYAREGNLILVSGHVNLVLDRVRARWGSEISDADALLVDFLPSADLRGQRSLPLQEATIVAMFMNNRAAEALSDGRLDDAYAWARGALLQDPSFDAAANTLAVVYQRAGHLREAEAALRSVLEHDPRQLSALGNLVQLLHSAGRPAEAQAAAARLAQLQPDPPFRFYDLGREAMDAGDFGRARDLFARELRRQPDQHEVLFWAAQADWRLGDRDAALRHLRQAMENSPTPGKHEIYAAKLDRLRALRLQ